MPATIAVLDGVPRVGLTDAELERICSPDAELDKLSLRDLGPTVALGRSGATTVASTAALAAAAGIPVFATGGLGGVHHPVPGTNVTWDVSADLGTLARTDVLVVCSAGDPRHRRHPRCKTHSVPDSATAPTTSPPSTYVRPVIPCHTGWTTRRRRRPS